MGVNLNGTWGGAGNDGGEVMLGAGGWKVKPEAGTPSIGSVVTGSLTMGGFLLFRCFLEGRTLGRGFLAEGAIRSSSSSTLFRWASPTRGEGPPSSQSVPERL